MFFFFFSFSLNFYNTFLIVWYSFPTARNWYVNMDYYGLILTLMDLQSDVIRMSAPYAMKWWLGYCLFVFYYFMKLPECSVNDVYKQHLVVTLFMAAIFWEPFVLAEKLLEHLFSRFRKFEWKGLYIRLIKRKLYIFPAFGWWFISQKIKEISRCQSTGMMFCKYSKIKWLGHFPGLL